MQYTVLYIAILQYTVLYITILQCTVLCIAISSSTYLYAVVYQSRAAITWLYSRQSRSRCGYLVITPLSSVAVVASAVVIVAAGVVVVDIVSCYACQQNALYKYATYKNVASNKHYTKVLYSVATFIMHSAHYVF